MTSLTNRRSTSPSRFPFGVLERRTLALQEVFVTRLKSLRVAAIVILILLTLQFELGMSVNLSPSLEQVPHLAGTATAVWGALVKVGGAALTHALLGASLTVIALASLVLAIISGDRSVAVIGIFSFLAIALAAVNGVLFTLSGFKDDNYSHGMATLFLLAFSLYFVQVCLLSVKLRRQAAV
jgi:hypothetical protein